MCAMEIKSGNPVLSAIIMALCVCLTATVYAADDYLDAIEAEAKAPSSSAVTSKQSVSAQKQEQQPAAQSEAGSDSISQAMRDEFYGALQQKSAATLRTYGKLDQKHQDVVVRFYFSNGKSTDKIVLTIFEQLTDQVRNQ